MNKTIYVLPLILAALCAPAFAQEAASSAPPSGESTEQAAQETPAEPPVPPAAASADFDKTLVDAGMLDYIRKKIDTDLVYLMVKNQNEHYADLSQEKIAGLDAQWVREREQQEQPLITATLANPLSSYLIMVQAHSYGLLSQIFVMDNKGLNVGQSDISSDYWQGDEAKWQKTFLAGPDAVLIDDPEFDGDKHIWIAQTTVALADPETGEPIGAATFDINLTELKRLRAAGAEPK